MLEEVAGYSLAELSQFRCVDGRYRLLAQLGTGRFGQVYLAYDLLSRELIALKEPLELSAPGRLESFLAEIAKMVYLREKGKALAVAQIREFNFEVREGTPAVYYTMDFALLGEFFSFLESAPLIDEDAVRYFFAQLAQAVSELHSLGLAHLDLKPENILLRPDSSLLLCDLGSAAWADQGAPAAYAGSREYCAPESLACLSAEAGEGPGAELDLQRLDSFSLGVILFVALFKSNPFMSAEPSDPYYRRLLYDREAFWEIFAPLRRVTPAARLFLEEMLLSPPAERPLPRVLLHSAWVSALPANPGFRDVLSSSLKEYRGEFEDNLLRQIRMRVKGKGEAEKPKVRARQLVDSVDLLRRFIRQNEEKISRLKKTLGKLSPLKPPPTEPANLRQRF